MSLRCLWMSLALVLGCSPSAGTSGDEGTETGEVRPTPFEIPLAAELVVTSDAQAVRDLQVRDDELWLCAEQGGVRRFDLSADPPGALPFAAGAPQRCAALDLNAAGDRMALSDGARVYVATRGRSGWSLEGQFDAPANDLLWVADDTLALAQGEAGLSTWRESGGAWAKHADPGETNIAAEGLALTDTGLAVAAGRAGLRLYTLADGAPTPSGGVPLDGYAVRAAIGDAGERAYVASLDAISTLDISTATPTVLSSESSDEVALDVAAHGEQLAVADFKQVHALALDDEGAARPHAIAFPGGEGNVDQIEARSMAVTFDDAGRLWAATWAGAERFANEPAAAPHGVPTQRELHFGEVPSGSSKTLVLAVENRGDMELMVHRVEFTSGRVSTPDWPWVVPPGEVQAVELEFTSDGEPLEAEAWIVSDDPHEQVRRVRLLANVPKLEVGDPMPEFIEVGRRGELVTSAELAGRVAMLSFFASWCSACNDEFPGYEQDLWQDLAQSGAGDLAIVGLGRESAARIDGFAATHAVTFPLSVDQELYERFAKPPGSVYALEYVFDREGVLRYAGRGATADELRPELEALLGP